MTLPNSYTTPGFYGTGTPCTIVVYRESREISWYAVEGSTNVNATLDEITTGTDVETLTDFDFFTANEPIDYPSELENEVNDYYGGTN